MRVVVLGAGLLGVTSAYYLQQFGHEVTVVDRHSTPAAKARGLPDAAAPASAGPAPADHRLRSAWRRISGGFQRAVARLFDRAVGAGRPVETLDHLVRLGTYSRDSVRALRDEAGVSQSPRGAGLLTVYTDADAFRHRTATDPHWRRLGCEDRLLSVAEAVQVEPALAPTATRLAGATYASEDPARDPSPFAASLVFICRAAGVRFLMRHTVVSLADRDGRIAHVELRDAEGRTTQLQAHAYVLALGAASVVQAERLGVPMPLRLDCELVVTMPLKAGASAPRVVLHDRQGRMRITRVDTPDGERLRASATVRTSLDAQDEPESDRFDAILRRVELLLPGVGDAAHAEFETATQAVSDDGLPMIGRTHLPNLFLNTAPGASGWVNACGAGKSIARIVSGLRPELDFAFRGL